MFDVRGEVAHFIIRGRILLQRSWRQGLDWDDTISEEDFKLWIKWLQDLKAISSLKIPRRYISSVSSLSQADNIELHVFADAGKEAFAASSYFVIETRGLRHSALVMAKVKVTPLKRNTLSEISQMPRLEMTACLIASRMAHTIKEFHSHLKLDVFMWSDSTIALTWIQNPNIKLEKFAIPIVEEILEKTDRNNWHYVPSELNPADRATKFQKFDFSDPNSIWFKGPVFLLQPQTLWPKKENNKLEEFHTVVICQEVKNPVKVVINKFELPSLNCQFSSDLVHGVPRHIKSNWIKLIRLVARALKLMERVKTYAGKEFQSSKETFLELEPLDYEKAELFVSRQMQYDAYEEEYKALEKGLPVLNKDFLALRIFMDSNGVLRINSRVALDPEIYPQRFLPFLPRKHFLTEVLLFSIHAKYNHVSNDTQAAEVRSKFWIPQLRRAVAHVKNICNYCGYLRAHPLTPPMAPLPKYRVDPQQKPFEVVGLDCTGEIVVYKHYKKSKVYILLFTCTLTRFVHVHLLDKMNALSVLEAITQFWSAHGPVFRFITDNGTNFDGAARRLRRDQEVNIDVKSELKEKRDLLRQQLAAELLRAKGGFFHFL
ncbi:hypothetical protein PVAND_014323 [Polypedilum vanderplanki]|nr:hypothetical protein PVAND_014323 [Polypedilum vanderplanki]